MKQGSYIVIEGMDCAGKTSMVAALAEKTLTNSKVVYTHAPRRTSPIGELIRRSFAGELTFERATFAWLMMADAVESDPEITKTLDQGTTIISDRHCMVSGWVYQSDTLTLPEVLSVQRSRFITEPTLVFLLDIDPATVVQRMTARGGSDAVFETTDVATLERTRGKYLSYAWMHSNVIILDAREPIAHNLNIILRTLADLDIL